MAFVVRFHLNTSSSNSPVNWGSDCYYPYFIDEETEALLRELRGFPVVTKLECESSYLKPSLISKPVFLTIRCYCLIIQAGDSETLALCLEKMSSLELTRYQGLTSSPVSHIWKII